MAGNASSADAAINCMRIIFSFAPTVAAII
jgi:hypothetical protein